MSGANNNKEHDIDALKFALDNQIGWQKYAEAKLLFLATISGGSLALLFEFVISNKIENIWLYKSVLLFFGLTSMISFSVSIAAIAHKFTNYGKGKAKRHSKLIAWKKVVEEDLDELIETSKKYNLDKQAKDILTEHFIGSKHTKLKYQRFNWGIAIYTLGLAGIFLFSVADILFGLV